MRLPAFLAPVALALLCASPLAAGDYYVSPSGSNVPGGGGPGNPWKTISYALSQISTQGHVVHVAAGTYDAALGENFPIAMEELVSIQGAGMGSSILDAGGAVIAVSFDPFGGTPLQKFGPDTQLSEMTLRNGGTGIEILGIPSAGNPANPTLRKLEVKDCSKGISVGGGLYEPGNVGATIESCLVRDCSSWGIEAANVPQYSSAIAISDTTVSGSGTGVEIRSGGPFPSGLAVGTLTRCEIRGCATGVRSSVQKGPVEAKLRDCLIRDCTIGAGVWPSLNTALVTLERCTVAGNQTGIAGASPGSFKFTLRSSILWGNAVADIDPGFSPIFSNHFDIHWSDVGGGWPIPADNLSVDPLFAAPGSGDYHLLPASPVIDMGDPAAAPGGVDLDLDPRVLDGDSDVLARADMGFDEYNRVHLTAPATVAPGASFALGCLGPSGWFYAAGLSLGTADIALGNLGSLLLAPGTLALLGGGVLPGSKLLAIPNDPLLSGLAVHFQFGAVDPSSGAGSTSNRSDLSIQ